MNERQGQVKSVTNRDFQSIKLWSFQLEGSDRYYRTGKNEPKVTEGQWIKFNEKNGIVMTETIMTFSRESAPTGAVVLPETVAATSVQGRTYAPATESQGNVSPASTSAVTGAQHTSVDVGKRIRYQAARRDASNIVIAALHCDHLPHATNVAKGKRLDLLLQYVEEITQTLLEKEEAA